MAIVVEAAKQPSLWTVLALALAITYWYSTKGKAIFPVVNSYPYDFLRRKAHHEYNTNAKGLIASGLVANSNNPISILVPNSQPKIVLPSRFADWVKTNRDLDHQELVRDEFFASYPGFEAQKTLHNPNRMLINIVQNKLSSSRNESILPILDAHLQVAVREYWGQDDRDWKTLTGPSWDDATTGIISRAAAAIFVGPEKSSDPEWQQLTRSYVSSYFSAVAELHRYPSWSRPLVQWFLPHCTSCRRIVRRVRVVMREVVEGRRRREKHHGHRYNNVVAWIMDKEEGRNVKKEDEDEPGDIQLALAMAAFFTTAEQLRQVIIDIARHPELVEPLREEIRGSLFGGGGGEQKPITVTSLANMELLDSVLKESQRLIPILVGLERKVIRPTSLPDAKGTLLPRGAHIMVDASDMWSPGVHPDDPEMFDGYRFLKKKRTGTGTGTVGNWSFVQSTKEHMVFGGGRHLCPGRFFANHELKLALAHIILNYDIRLKKGNSEQVSKPIQIGTFAMVDPGVQIEVRRSRTE